MKYRYFVWLSTVICFFVPLAKPCMGETAEEMLSACRAISLAKVSNGTIKLPQDFESGECWGAFETLQDLLNVRDTTTKNVFFNICLPVNSTRTELIAIFIQYIEKHPEKYQDEFTGVALSALWKPFHCKLPPKS